MTTNPQLDVLEAVRLTLEALAQARNSEEAAQCAEPNAYLTTSLTNYLGLLRRRPLTSAYEFLTPPADLDGRRAGWYWRHPSASSRDWINWHGPFASRKAAVEDKIKLAPRTRSKFLLDKVEREIFSEELTQCTSNV